MKLLGKTTLIIVTISLFIFFFGGVGFYYAIRSMMNQQIDKELKTDMQQTLFDIQLNKSLPDSYYNHPNKLEFEQLQANTKFAEALKDTILYNQSNKLYSLFRVYSSKTTINQQNYKVSIYKSKLSTDELIEKIILTFTLMALALILVLFFFNKYSFKKIWNDFFFTLKKIQDYEIKHGEKLKLPDSEIEEFNTLNTQIEKMTDRIHQDYMSLKEFTENASHEIQTPLSILKAKIELLLQMENLKQDQIQLIASLYESVNRLSNLNKALILLTRIENDQFPDKAKINLKERIEYHLENFSEAIKEKEIKLTINLIDEAILEINPELFDILIINLIKNAIRHNHLNGNIRISATENDLIISNNGPAPNIPPEKLFNRFTKSNFSKKSLGLGLALVKKICDLYHFEIQYTYSKSLHTIHIDFK